MHQARHRHVSQDMLDLKRLYWHCRAICHGSAQGIVPTSCSGWSCLRITGGRCSKWLPRN